MQEAKRREKHNKNIPNYEQIIFPSSTRNELNETIIIIQCRYTDAYEHGVAFSQPKTLFLTNEAHDDDDDDDA